MAVLLLLLCGVAGSLVAIEPKLALLVAAFTSIVGLLARTSLGQVHRIATVATLGAAAGWNPTLMTGGELAVHLSTVLLIPTATAAVVLGASRREQDRDAGETARTVLTFMVALAAVALVQQLFLPTVPEHFTGNLFRLAILTLFVVAFIPAVDRFRGLLTVSWWVSVANSLALILGYMGGTRSISFRIDPSGQAGANAFGAMVATLIVLRISFRSAYTIRRNALDLALGVPVLAAAILYSYSRGGMLALVVGLLAIIVLELRRSPIATALAVGGGALLSQWVLGSELVTARFRNVAQISDSGRGEIFSRALRGFLDAPILGQGFGRPVHEFSTGAASAHNVPLQIAFEMGAAGLLLATLLLWKLRRHLTSSRTMPAVASLVVVSFTDNHFLAVQFGWLPALVILAGANDIRTTERRPRRSTIAEPPPFSVPDHEAPRIARPT